VRALFFELPKPLPPVSSSLLSLSLLTAMSHLSAEVKQHILLEYTPDDASRSLSALARRHAVKGGGDTLRRWFKRWDGSPASLERRAGSGRPRVLSAAEVRRHVRAPILAANRAHRAISYTELQPRVQAATGKTLSVRTLRRYGEEELGAKAKHTKKRTAAESEYTDTGGGTPRLCLLRAELTCAAVSLPCVTRSQPCAASCRRPPLLAFFSWTRLHSASTPLQRRQLCYLASRRTCWRPTLLPTPLATT